jgi:hypothetical protein
MPDMKITIRAICKRDVVAAFAADPANAALVDVASLTIADLDATSPAFDRLLEAARGRSRCWFHAWMEFSAAEIASCRLLQLECRGRVLREGRREYDLNVARLRSLPFIDSGPGARIRLLDRITLRGVRLKPNQVACAAEWMAEFVVSRGVARIFETAGLTGCSFMPLVDAASGEPYEDAFQLYTNHIMPRAGIDVTTPIHPDEADRHHRRELGCLTYHLEGNLPSVDFLRTAEAWSSNDMPVWIVSRRVRECFVKNQLRGWAFRPVLEAGTDLHEAYIRSWHDLVSRVAASHPGHIF